MSTPMSILIAVMATFGTSTAQLNPDEVFCLAQNIYFEASVEHRVGKSAVAHVTLNRVDSPRYPDSVCEVVWQDRQFSWTQDGKSDRNPAVLTAPVSNGRGHSMPGSRASKWQSKP